MRPAAPRKLATCAAPVVGEQGPAVTWVKPLWASSASWMKEVPDDSGAAVNYNVKLLAQGEDAFR